MSSDENVLPLAGRVTPKSDPQLDKEFGVTSPLPGGSWDSYITGTAGEISNRPLVPIEDLVLMRRKDGQARALVRLLTLPIRAAMKDAEWIEPDDGGAEQEVAFANLMWNTPPQNGGMTTPKSKIIRNTLLAIPDGYAVFEEVRHVPEDGPLKGKITLRKLAYRDARTVRFRVDDEGGFNGIRQIANVNGHAVDVLIPKEKVWYYANNEEENPYYGISAFEPAWSHFDIKRKLYYIAHLAAQFSAVPARVGIVPPNPDLKELKQFRDGLANFAFNTSMVAPPGYEVTLQNSTGSFDFLKLIDHHNHMMSRSVLCGFIDSEDRPALVDIAKADPQADMYVVALESVMQEIAESWTYHLMPQYIDWNFGTKKYPVFKFGQLSDSAKEAIKEIFIATVVSSTLNCTPEFIREMEKKLADRLGFDIDYESLEKQEKVMAAEQQKKAEQEAQMAADSQAQMDLQTAAGAPGAPKPPGGGKPFGGGPKPPGGAPPTGPPTGPPKLVAASRQSDIDELVNAAEELLLRHVDEDLSWVDEPVTEDD